VATQCKNMKWLAFIYGSVNMASGSGYGPVAGPSEHGNEPSDSIKGGEFLD
jgi:hypothetical protein